LADIVALLCQARWRGELVVFDADHVRSLFFSDGNILGAVTNVEAERIGSVLYKFGAIDAAQRGHVLDNPVTGKRFGEVALELGWLTREQLYQFILRQIEEIVFSVLSLTEGTFFFLDGFDEARLSVRHAVSASTVLMESVARIDEVRFFRQKIPSTEHVPVLVGDRDLPSEFATLAAALDGRRSVGEIGRVTGLGEFETTKQLYALVQSHRVEIHPPATSGGPLALVEAANAALQVIFEAVDAEDRAEELRSSLSSFVNGTGLYDILFRGAGPDRDGRLDPAVVVQNSSLIAGGAGPAYVIQQLLHEYVSFALFSVGALLGASIEAELAREIAPWLGAIRPVG
jgi:hypothetical protein